MDLELLRSQRSAGVQRTAVMGLDDGRKTFIGSLLFASSYKQSSAASKQA